MVLKIVDGELIKLNDGSKSAILEGIYKEVERQYNAGAKYAFCNFSGEAVSEEEILKIVEDLRANGFITAFGNESENPHTINSRFIHTKW